MLGIELTPEHPVARVGGLAASAEDAGFDTVFVSHHYNNRDEFVALADIARRTDSVRLGPGITNPYESHPVTLASRAATIDEYADGRGVYGIGPGDRSTLGNLGYDHDDALRRVLETMQVSRRLWDGDRVDHDGTFEAADAGLNYEARRLPIYVGAQGPHMTRMAAKHADGVLYNGAHPRDIEWAGDRVREGLAERPDDSVVSNSPSHQTGIDGEFDFAAYASVSLATTEEAAREAARPPVAFIASGAPAPVLDRHGLDEDLTAEIGAAIAAGEFESAFGLVTEEMIDAFCLAGTPESTRDQFEAILSEADSLVMGSPLGPDLDEAIELMGELATGLDL
ncbi:5,10-methylenetetrahydromethanopterin reductase [Halovenus sp. WSH3]|uniref:5,10-methylenetetrahydromethanopterin reductase n=1 Tax=Halovenus carboxidivorans TaxID=2692199 RepID=A0A6B0T220_9EURY|nr:5,10-methylenetetrahydromethanopterin reductase [Halovenus carboxidivorans]MXR52005.1 5,10-methylenetetrahydromethanopterin reductase [Halovenus carboxidivorans]